MLLLTNKLVFVIVILSSTAHGCWWRGSLNKDDCEDFKKNDQGCENIHHGRLQATEMTADLYKVSWSFINS